MTVLVWIQGFTIVALFIAWIRADNHWAGLARRLEAVINYAHLEPDDQASIDSRLTELALRLAELCPQQDQIYKELNDLDDEQRSTERILKDPRMKVGLDLKNRAAQALDGLKPRITELKERRDRINSEVAPVRDEFYRLFNAARAAGRTVRQDVFCDGTIWDPYLPPQETQEASAS